MTSNWQKIHFNHKKWLAIRCGSHPKSSPLGYNSQYLYFEFWKSALKKKTSTFSIFPSSLVFFSSLKKGRHNKKNAAWLCAHHGAMALACHCHSMLARSCISGSWLTCPGLMPHSMSSYDSTAERRLVEGGPKQNWGHPVVGPKRGGGFLGLQIRMMNPKKKSRDSSKSPGDQQKQCEIWKRLKLCVQDWLLSWFDVQVNNSKRKKEKAPFPCVKSHRLSHGKANNCQRFSLSSPPNDVSNRQVLFHFLHLCFNGFDFVLLKSTPVFSGPFGGREFKSSSSDRTPVSNNMFNLIPNHLFTSFFMSVAWSVSSKRVCLICAETFMFFPFQWSSTMNWEHPQTKSVRVILSRCPPKIQQVLICWCFLFLFIFFLLVLFINLECLACHRLDV